MSATNRTPAGRLPPTTDALFDDNARPYFLWWTNVTVGRFKEHLASPDPEARPFLCSTAIELTITQCDASPSIP